jgi:serine/threonine protein kinase
MESFHGTPLYMSPQILNEEGNYTSKCDIWSLGVIFYEILHGRTPWGKDCTQLSLAWRIKNK